MWSEKPLGITRESARQVLDDAARAGLLVGVAPDTLLGPGFQTARRAIERGDIGVPLSAQTVFQYPGPDLFHPNPEFLFAAGAGPLFDLGPFSWKVMGISMVLGLVPATFIEVWKLARRPFIPRSRPPSSSSPSR